jgi:2-polyprenyl-6-hydroxyphenyl methylase/3-demethylubiquinone-9 3-methyltransferase
MKIQSSIDTNEVEFYGKLSARWWDEGGPFWPLHRMNGLRLSFLSGVLTKEFDLNFTTVDPLKNLRILDIGCGGGILSEPLARLGAAVHGVDVTTKNIITAQQHAASQGLKIDYEVASAEILAGRGEQYDIVLNMEVVEHVAELDFFLNACMKLIRPGGIMVVATINRTCLSWLGAIVMAELILGWMPRGTHRWSRFPTPVELENVLTVDGLSVFARTGIGLNPFSKRFFLTPYMGINYILCARKPTLYNQAA